MLLLITHYSAGLTLISQFADECVRRLVQANELWSLFLSPFSGSQVIFGFPAYVVLLHNFAVEPKSN